MINTMTIETIARDIRELIDPSTLRLTFKGVNFKVEFVTTMNFCVEVVGAVRKDHQFFVECIYHGSRLSLPKDLLERYTQLSLALVAVQKSREKYSFRKFKGGSYEQ